MKIIQKWSFTSALLISAIILFCLQSLLDTKTEPVPDFSKFSQIPEKKQAFFAYMYKQIQPINEDIKNERLRLIKLNEKVSNDTLAAKEQVFVEQLMKKYRVSATENASSRHQISALMMKVDQLPPSLILAQAANESAWGTSRFATQANNYFGIWCYSKGCGLIPKLRNKGATHEVRYFKSTKESVSYYINLLNSHKKYAELRQIRADLRKASMPITGSQLAQGLKSYSERGTEYINDLLSVIRFNKLNQDYPLVKIQES